MNRSAGTAVVSCRGCCNSNAATASGSRARRAGRGRSGSTACGGSADEVRQVRQHRRRHPVGLACRSSQNLAAGVAGDAPECRGTGEQAQAAGFELVCPRSFIWNLLVRIMSSGVNSLANLSSTLTFAIAMACAANSMPSGRVSRVGVSERMAMWAMRCRGRNSPYAFAAEENSSRCIRIISQELATRFAMLGSIFSWPHIIV